MIVIFFFFLCFSVPSTLPYPAKKRKKQKRRDHLPPQLGTRIDDFGLCQSTHTEREVYQFFLLLSSFPPTVFSFETFSELSNNTTTTQQQLGFHSNVAKIWQNSTRSSHFSATSLIFRFPRDTMRSRRPRRCSKQHSRPRSDPNLSLQLRPRRVHPPSVVGTAPH
jgi:hypothetical protein